MANRIKGITVEIGGDTTKLSKALEGVNKNIKNTQTQLKDVQKLLKLDPSNTELLSQKHKLLADAVTATKEKLETLKTAAEQANQALANGDISQSSTMPCSVRSSKRNRNCRTSSVRRRLPARRLPSSVRREKCLKKPVTRLPMSVRH